MKKIYLLLLLSFLSIASFAAGTSAIGTVTVAASSDCGGGSYEIFALTNTQGTTPSTASTFKFVTTGSYTAADVTVFSLYSNSSNSLAGATFIGSVTATAAGTQTISMGSLTMPASTTVYYMVYATVAASPTAGHTITVSAITNAAGTPFTFTGTAPAYTASSASAGGTQTLAAQPAAITGTTTVCTGATVTLADVTSGGTWSSGNTSIATNAAGVIRGITGGSVTITYSTGCGTPATTMVTVNTPPASISGSNNICKTSTTTLSDATVNGTWSSSAAGIATVGATTGIVGGIAPGTVTVTYTTGCGTAATEVMTVIATPVAIGGGAASVCIGANTAAFTDASAYGTWSSSDITIASNVGGVFTGVSAGTVTVTYSNGCGSAVTTTLIVKDVPASISGSNNVCKTSTTTLSDATVNGTWSSSAAGIATVGATTGIVGGIAAGTVTVTYTTGCGTAATEVMTVIATPVAIAGGTPSVCAGANTAAFTDASAYGTWSSGDITIATNIAGVFTGVSAGTVTVTYSNGCGSAATTTLTVKGTPVSISGSNTVCKTATTTLTDAMPNGAWSSSATGVATAGAATGIVGGIAGGTTTISYSTGCGAAATLTMTVLVTPVAITGTTYACPGGSTTLTDITTGGAWSSSNTGIATVSATGTVTGIFGGITTITYSNGCGAGATTTYTVNPTPAISLSNAGPTCNTAITASGASTYTWAPATGLSSTTGASQSPVPTVDVIYTVTGTSTAGCVGATTASVSAMPVVTITSPAICTTGTLSVSAIVYGGTISGYTWSPATGLAATTGASIAATPAILTTYSVTATGSNGCTGGTTVAVGAPTVNVTPGAADGCTGVAQPYTASGAATYVWAPSTNLSATTGASVSATPTTTGYITYTITGTDTRGCMDTNTVTSGGGTIALLPWTEGFETYTNTVSCNETMGPDLITDDGHDGTGSAATVEGAAGTAAGYGSAPVQIPAHTGAGLGGFGFHADNDYFFTPGFLLTAGTTYKYSFWYRIDGGLTYTDDYNANMVYNTTQSLTGATTFSNFTTAVIPGSTAALTAANLASMQNATYKQWTGYFTPATGGTYYFGINALNNNLTNTYYWGFDDVAFNVASNCASPAAATAFSVSPVDGATTNLSVTSTADSFLCVSIPIGSGVPTSGPVNGTNYLVGSSLGGGTILAKGATSGTTAASSGYLSPGTSYNFYVYTYEHDSCNGVAYSTSYTSTSTSPSFITCSNSTPSTPTIYSMLPGVAGTANVTLSGLPTNGTVIVHAYTNAAGTIPSSPASYTVTADSSTLSISDASVYSGAHIWYTVDQTIGGCTVTSFVSQQASVPFSLPWSQKFETGSSNNLLTPNYMQSNLGFYTDQTSTVYGAEDNHGATYVSPHSGSWDFLFFGGVTTSMSAPGTGAPYIPLAVYPNQWLETPGLYCPQAGTYKLTFWYDNPSGSFPSINIQYSNIPTLPSNSSSTMTSAISVATVTPTLGGGWHQYTATINISTGPQTIFVGFDVAALSTSGYMAFDDIEICEVPTVAVTNSSASIVACTSGTLSLSATPTPSVGLTSGIWNYTWSGPGTIASTLSNANVTGLASVGVNPVYTVNVINSQDIFSVCASAPANTTATITPTPTAITGAASICGGASALYSGGASLGTPGWSISGTGSTYVSGSVTSGYNVSSTNPPSQQTVTINYSNGCGTATPKTVNINVQPAAITASDFISVPATAICTLRTTTYTDNTSGGTWSNTPTTYGSINSSTGIFNSNSTSGTTTIAYIMSTGACSVTASLAVGTSGPTAITGGASSVCVGASTSAFASTPTGGAWSISPITVATISGTAIVTGIANTNGTPATITYNTGCGTAATYTIAVNGTTGSLTSPATVCSGSPLTLSSAGLVPSSGLTYSWSGPGSFTSTVANPVISSPTLSSNGIYTLTVTKGGCANSYTSLGTVAQVPSTPTITATNQVLCSGSSTSLSSSVISENAQVFAIPVYTPTFAVSGTLNSATSWTSGTSNDGYYSISLPFNFNFYGSTYNTLYIGTNGYVTFNAGSTLATTAAITAGTPGNIAALFQNDLTLASSGSIQYGTTGTAPNRQFIVYYNSVPGATAGGPNTGYVVFNESTNIIDIIVNSFKPNTGGKSTCGIASATGAGGIAATGRNNVSYTITTPEAWRFYSLNNYNYTWGPSTGLTSTTVANPATPVLTTTEIYTLTVADEILSSCTSSNTYTVTVDSAASATIVNAQACIGATSVNMPYSNASGNPTTYSINWTSGAIDANFTNVSNATFPGGVSGNIPIAIGNLATPGSNYQGTITFNNAGSCPTSYLFTLSMEAQPSLNLAALSVNPSATTMCTGLIIDLNVTGATGGASPYIYTWKGPGITGSATTASGTLVYTTNVAASGMYSVSLSSSSTGCNTTPYLTTTSVYTVLSTPVPTVSGLTASVSSICAASTFTLTAGSITGGALYNWTGPNGYNTSGTLDNVAVTPTTTAASGIYSVTLTNTVTTCTSNVAVTPTVVTVSPLPYAGIISGVYTVCPTLTTALSDGVSGGVWSSSNTSIATVSTAGVVTGILSGTANISYSYTNSCGTATTYSAVTVNPLPNAGTISGTYSVCPALTTTLNTSISGGIWSSSATGIATVNSGGTVYGVSAGTVNISYAYSNNCGTALVYSVVTVNPSPAAGTISGTYTVCPALTTTLSDGTPGGTWSSSSTGVATVNTGGVVYGVAAGTANITYSYTNNCGTAVVYSTVTVNPLPNAGVISGTYSLCPALTTNLSDGVGGGTWTSSATGIATVNTGGVVYGVSAGTSNISYTYTNSCGTAYAYSVVTVNPLPSAGTISGTYTVCPALTTTLSDGVSGGIWSSGTTSIATVNTGGVVYGVAAGTSNISYSYTNSCGTAVVYSVITVNASPSAGIISGTYTVCPALTTTLSDGISGGTWSSSAAAIATVNTGGVVYGVAAGTANISYTVTNMCGTARVYSVVTVNALPSSGTISGTYTVCPASTTGLSDGVSGGTWSSSATGVATVNTGGVVYGVAAGTTNISYAVTNGCGTARVYSVITVNALPSAGSISGTYTVCPALTTTLSDGVSGGIWSSGTTSIATVNTGGIVYGVAAGSANISYAVTNSCGTARAYSVITVNALPSAGTISGTYTICASSTGTLSDGVSGGTWSSSATGIATVNTSGIVYGVTAGSATISYAVANSCGTARAYSVVTINTQPSVTLSVSATNICSGSNEILVATPSGGIGAPVYTWSGPGIVSNTGITAAPAAYTPTVVTTTSGAYSVAVSYPGTGCATSHSASSVVTVSPQPLVNVNTSATTLCNGTVESLTATVTYSGPGIAAYTWSGPGISGSAGPYASSIYTVAPSTGTASGAYSVVVSYSVAGCNNATNSSSVVSLMAQQWKGAASSAWSNAANWTCGSVPTAAEDIVIPGVSSYTFAPNLDVSIGYAHNLTIAANGSLTLGSGNQLYVADTLTNNDTISGDGAIYLNGTSAQVLRGNGLVSNLTLANSAGAYIDTTADTVGITGTLLLNSGTLHTNGTLVLVSDSLSNGCIGTITGGSISGRVVMEQYIPSGRRAYRFVAHPFTDSISLGQIEPYIDITGAGGAANGFTSTITNASSAFWYNSLYGNSSLGSDPGWRSFTSTYSTTDSNMLRRYQGMRLFVRGAKGEGLSGVSYVINAATYRTYGSVNTGAQTIPMVKGTGANADYNLLGNPYPAVTDIGTVIDNASAAGQVTGAAYYVWDPYRATSGQFVTIPIGAGAYYLGANESFEVRTAANGDSLNFVESNKGNVVSTALMRTGIDQYLTINIYDNTYHPWDMLYVKFNDGATDNEDAKYDGTKPPSPAPFNFYSLSGDAKRLSLDSRPFSAGKVIPLGITSSYKQEFIMKADNVAVPAGDKVYLHDKYLQTYTLLQQGTEYRFTISSDSLSQGDKRFELSMNPASVTAIASNKGLDVQMMPNPATSDVTISYTAAGKAATSVRVMNVEGVTVLSQDLGMQQDGNAKINLDKLASGVYLVEFTSGTDKVVHRLVKE